MSNIQTFLEKILSARYGKDVRQSIHDAIEEVDRVADTAQNSATESANAARKSAQTAALNAQEAERFRNEAAAIVPEGYADLVEQVNENTVKVDTIIEKADLGIKETASGEEIHLIDSAEEKAVEFALYGKAKQDGEPTPENPQEIEVSGESGSVEVKSCGKNFLKHPYYYKSQTLKGVTFDVDEKTGKVTTNGEATGDIDFIFKARVDSSDYQYQLPIGDYILSGCPVGGSSTTYFIGASKTVNDTAQNLGFDYGNGANIDISNDVTSTSFYIKIRSGVKVSGLVFEPMIRLASDTDDTYEPYKETLSTIPTENGLAGIKVSSNGNYTDQNGQQWICDEIVKYADGSGKLIQRVGKAVFDGSEDEAWTRSDTGHSYEHGEKYRIATNYISGLVKPPTDNNKAFIGLSNIGITVPAGAKGTYDCYNGVSVNTNGTALHVYSDMYNTSDVSLWTSYLSENPMTLYYELATPITTPLTSEEIAEISTFYPVTNISNDFDCGMYLKYKADSKNYIDKRLALIEQALVNSI